MRYSLLDMTQRILESMESDEVNSISDTVESQAVANIIKETYWFLVGRMDLPANHNFFQLEASGDSTQPVLMTVPDDVLDIDWIKYKFDDDAGNSEYRVITFLPLEDFLRRTLTLKEDDTIIDTMNVTLDTLSFEFKFYNDRQPMFYTSTDNSNLFFDAYDSTDSSTLVKARTLCFGKKLPEFLMQDSFVPQLDPTQFQLLLNEAKMQAFNELKQMENVQAARRAQKSFITTQRTKRNIPTKYPEIRRVPDYGRK